MSVVEGSGFTAVLERDGVRCVVVVDLIPERSSLSPRELEIARLVARGATNRAIGSILDISSWTVSTHLRRIFARLGVSSRAEMVSALFAVPQVPTQPESPEVRLREAPDRSAVHVRGLPGGKVSDAVGQPRATKLDRLQTIVAVALIVIFLAFLVALVEMRNDANWDRLMNLLAGLESLVFAGAGALFGTTVQRANVDVARQDAKTARDDAAAQKSRADKMEGKAHAGEMLATTIRTKRKIRSQRSPGATDGDLAELAALADEMFPEGPERSAD